MTEKIFDLEYLKNYTAEYSEKRRKTESASCPQEARQHINHMIKRFCSFIPDYLDDASKAALLHDAITRNVTYEYKECNPIQYTAIGVLLKKKGVCEGISQLYRAFLNELGIPNCFIVGYGHTRLHSWNQIYLKEENSWYHIDVTWNLGKSYRDNNTIYFLKSDDEMRANQHTWILQNHYQVCPQPYTKNINLNQEGVELICQCFKMVTSLKSEMYTVRL